MNSATASSQTGALAPDAAELVIDTAEQPVEVCVERILGYIEAEFALKPRL